MQNESNGAPVAAHAVQRWWAVVCTGFISKDYEAITITDSNKNRCPVIIRLFATREQAESMLKRIQRANSRVSGFVGRDWSVTTPIYGLSETDVEVKKRQTKDASDNAGDATEETGAGSAKPKRGRGK